MIQVGGKSQGCGGHPSSRQTRRRDFVAGPLLAVGAAPSPARAEFSTDTVGVLEAVYPARALRLIQIRL